MLVFLSFATFQHTPYFADRDAVALVRTQFLRASLENHCEILSYGFAPDRAELLIEAAADERPSFVRTSRIYSARAFRARTGGVLWARNPTEVTVFDDASAAAWTRRVMTAPVHGSFAWDLLKAVVRSPPAKSI